MISDMNIRRRVFLNELCLHCGGKIFRYLLGRVVNDGDNEDCVMQTAIADCCTGNCEQVCCESPIAYWPLCSLEQTFDDWDQGKLTRHDFDAEITKQLERANVFWTLTETG